MCYTTPMKRRKKTKQPGARGETLLVDDSYTIHRKKGNGAIRRQVWVDRRGRVTRYSLAYINHQLFHGDNGRVLGYDNAHDYHHKHYFGQIEAINYTSFEELETRFQHEFEVLHAQVKKRS